jgi:hypothetical protein
MLVASSGFFGSAFVPAKKYEIGDGIFYQFFFCSGIYVVGFICNVFRSYPRFEPVAMIGGFSWCIGISLDELNFD